MVAGHAVGQSPGAPNIIVFLADDMGYGEVGVYNAESKIPTPNLDQIAGEGIRFMNAHYPSAVCTPTRYGTLAGRYAWRTRLQNGIVRYFDEPLIAHSRQTLPEMLRNHGYATAGIGKWRLGLNIHRLDDAGFVRTLPAFEDSAALANFAVPIADGPISHGFDYYFGQPGGNIKAFVENDQYVGQVTDNGDEWGIAGWVESDKGQIQLDKALAFIDQHHADNLSAGTQDPFFMYYASHFPHTPFDPPDHINGIPVAGVSDAGPRGDLVVQNDVIVGGLLNRLAQHGLDDDTLLIVTSDNGALLHGNDDGDRFDHKSNGNWRGRKADVFEGGHRVPFIARWGDGTAANSTIAPGQVNDDAVGLTDLMATFAALVGEELDDDTGEDSENLLPLLLDESGDQSVRKDIVHHSNHGMFAIRQGDWKLVRGDGSGGVTQPRGTIDALPGLLYNLAQDPGETDNVWADHPDIVARLLALLDHYQQSGRSGLRFKGDMNRDGRIDRDDWDLLAMNLGVGTTLEEGDFNGDGFVDGGDFEIFDAAFAAMNGGTHIPEPACVPCAVLGIALLAGRRRRAGGQSGDDIRNVIPEV